MPQLGQKLAPAGTDLWQAEQAPSGRPGPKHVGQGPGPFDREMKACGSTRLKPEPTPTPFPLPIELAKRGGASTAPGFSCPSRSKARCAVSVGTMDVKKKSMRSTPNRAKSSR